MNSSHRADIATYIDLDAEGKAIGSVSVPHSVHHPAYGWIPISIARIKNGDGRDVLIQVGNHGDKWEARSDSAIRSGVSSPRISRAGW